MSEKNIKIKFEKENKRVIAIDNENIAGICNFIEEEKTWNIVHTEVKPKYQGQGIAKKLVECVIKEAKKNNKNLIADCSYAKKILGK